jgi:tRNA(Arg) A34 adenosine deaminase TadA
MCLSAAYWARISTIYYANTQSDAKEIGFDDSFIYQELKKPMEERTMKMHHLSECRTKYAKQVFDKWNLLSDKRPY